MSNMYGTWRPETDDKGQYITWQWATLQEFSYMRIAGLNGKGAMVTEFELSYSWNGKDWGQYAGVLDGGRDATLGKEHLFEPSFHAKFVRIKPTAWKEYIA